MNRKTVSLVHSLFVVLLLTVGSIFAQSDVPRKTVAITYPLDQEIKVQFRGTTRFPRLRGAAKVKRINKSGTRVEMTLDNMPRPYELGGAYTTRELFLRYQNGGDHAAPNFCADCHSRTALSY
jgi:hypothetical protein